MKSRNMSFMLALVMLLRFLPVYSYALENGSQPEYIETSEEITEYDLVSPNATEYAMWTAVTLQGDTGTPADCKAFEDALANSDNDYGDYLRCSWEINNNGEARYVAPPASASELVYAKYYHVAYYSGHGDSDTTDGVKQPCLNYYSSDSQKIFVASAFDIANNDWASTTVISPYNSLRVLILAACSQLNETNAKFYARLMKVSGIRAIPGYYNTAPSGGDDTIATNFVGNCNNGNSIASAWGNANSGQPWAVLVYFSNNNQYYRLPGFPGATYSAPASNANVYIIKEGVQGATVVTAAQPGTNDELMDAVAGLPLTILTSDTSAKATVEEFSREAVWSDAVPDGKRIVLKALASELGDIDSKQLVEYHVTKEVVDPDLGVLHDTSEIIERTYRYYDTYNGIKIADSFVEASVDSQGLSSITAQKKTVVSDVGTASAAVAGAAQRGTAVSDAQAFKTLLAEYPSLADEELRSVSLAYAPDGNGNHVLSYEFLIGGGFYYVSVSDGEVLWF